MRSLETRVIALESSTARQNDRVLVVGPYSELSDPASHLAQAREDWFRRYGAYPGDDVRVLHIVLCGVKPTGEAIGHA